MSSGEGKVVCVTGASGYIASWILKLLLQRGYTVRATVRDPNDPKKTENLFALDGAKERLHLFKADLLEESSFDSAVDGCEGVFHTASPVSFSITDPQAELIDPALKGTLNVLKSCAKFPSVKKVIVTSSMASVTCNGQPMNPDVVVDETWFSDPALCEKLKMWYPLSKTLAEKAAWNFSKENGIDLVVMNPGFTIGPMLQPTLGPSIKFILNLINGVQTVPTTIHRFVDVRDVASAHIQALEVPAASGRYCLVESVTHYSETLKILRELCPTAHVHEKCEDEPLYKISNEKAKGLGINFIPWKVSLKETVESLKEKGFLNV